MIFWSGSCLGIVADFMTLKFRRLMKIRNIRTMRLPDKTMVVVNIVLMFYCEIA